MSEKRNEIKKIMANTVFQCAEAIVEIKGEIVHKRRIEKRYRVKEIDEEIRRERTRNEAKIIEEARRNGVPTPIILDITDYEITMEKIDGDLVREKINESISERIGESVAALHKSGIIHGDLTTSNIILGEDEILYFIDFGLAYFSESVEARGVDVHVFMQSLRGGHEAEEYEKLKDAFVRGYKKDFRKAEEVLRRAEEIEQRGRYVERRNL